MSTSSSPFIIFFLRFISAPDIFNSFYRSPQMYGSFYRRPAVSWKPSVSPRPYLSNIFNVTAYQDRKLLVLGAIGHNA
jgi:hypothetical protein